ncbi:MAG: hypothetical protein WCG31_11590 [Deltaproteobacteria bacterium]
MKKKFTAAILSAFVFPGLGQLYLGSKLKGGILLILVNILILTMSGLLLLGLYRIPLPPAIPDYATAERIARQLISETPSITWSFAFLFSVWLYGVVDALLCTLNDNSS